MSLVPVLDFHLHDMRSHATDDAGRQAVFQEQQAEDFALTVHAASGDNLDCYSVWRQRKISTFSWMRYGLSCQECDQNSSMALVA